MNGRKAACRPGSVDRRGCWEFGKLWRCQGRGEGGHHCHCEYSCEAMNIHRTSPTTEKGTAGLLGRPWARPWDSSPGFGAHPPEDPAGSPLQRSLRNRGQQQPCQAGGGRDTWPRPAVQLALGTWVWHAGDRPGLSGALAGSQDELGSGCSWSERDPKGCWGPDNVQPRAEGAQSRSQEDSGRASHLPKVTQQNPGATQGSTA